VPLASVGKVLHDRVGPALREFQDILDRVEFR
jgi:hypothetical protein